jgi:tetratricopeptide (TPR) repeat protein
MGYPSEVAETIPEGTLVRAEARHQLKQDRFSRVTIDAAEATVHWSVEHRSKLIVAAIIAVVVAATAIGGWYYLNSQDDKASLDLSQAVRTLDLPIRPAGVPAQPDEPSFGSSQERDTAAQRQFQAVVDKYPHAYAADVARYFLGTTSADLGDNAAAERDYKAVADVHNKDLAALAKFALASVYRNTNRNKDAIDLYNQLIAKPTNSVGKAEAQIALADTYQANHQTADARKMYEQVRKENPAGDISQLVTEKLQDLK